MYFQENPFLSILSNFKSYMFYFLFLFTQPVLRTSLRQNTKLHIVDAIQEQSRTGTGN